MKKYSELTRLLDFMEENIDMNHIREIEQLQYDAINYNKISRLPLSVCTEPKGFSRLPMDEICDNPEKMLYNAIIGDANYSPYNSVKMKDDSPLVIDMKCYKGIIASLFGCKVTTAGEDTVVEPLGIYESKKNCSRGIPSVKNGDTNKIVNTYLHFHERLKCFPKCYEAMHISQPEMYSPFDLAGQIIGKNICVVAEDNPRLADDIVDITAQICVNFKKEIDPFLTDKINDAFFISGLCCGGRVLIKTNYAFDNYNDKIYEKYFAEPNEIILEAFCEQGGGSFHCCNIEAIQNCEILKYENLRCLDCCSASFENIVELYNSLKAKKIGIVGLGRSNNYTSLINSIIKENRGKIETGVTLMCRVKTIEQGIATINDYKERAI